MINQSSDEKLSAVRIEAGASKAQDPAAHESGNSLSESRRRELADFLRTRREKLKPEQMGLAQSARRRTPGLRREEVAELAGVGTTWYTWLEQARDIQPSAEVLRRLGNALKLTTAEVRHMFSLAGKAPPNELDANADKVSESLMRFFNDGLQVPAVLVGSRWDILAANAQTNEMFPGIAALPADRRNWLYYVFCSPHNRENLSIWEEHGRRVLAEFRASLSDSLDHPWVVELVTMLKAESVEFEQWWKEHDVRENAAVVMEFNHPTKGKVQLERTVLRPWENSRLKILIFTPLS
jgi:transcriptional regulator with XRE-family HTH domain